MKRPDFERCTSEATKLLYKQKVSERILNIQTLTYDKNIIFETIQNYSLITKIPIELFLPNNNAILKDGCTIYQKKNDVYIILYNDNINYFEHLNWTLAHEIGHIYLGHTNDNDVDEIEAHFFASQLFMPEYSLFMASQKYGPLYPKDIAEIFGVSMEAAIKRIHTMNNKYFYDCSNKSKEIWDAQERRVSLYFDCKKDGSDYRNTLSFLNDMEKEHESEMERDYIRSMQSYI